MQASISLISWESTLALWPLWGFFPVFFLLCPMLTDCYLSPGVQLRHHLLQPSKTWSSISPELRRICNVLHYSVSLLNEGRDFSLLIINSTCPQQSSLLSVLRNIYLMNKRNEEFFPWYGVGIVKPNMKSSSKTTQTKNYILPATN